MERYVRAWQIAAIDEFVRLVAEDVRFIMPPLTAWFDRREAVATFVATAIFGPARPYRGQLRAGTCNGQPSFATYEPARGDHLAVIGLHALHLHDVRDPP